MYIWCQWCDIAESKPAASEEQPVVETAAATPPAPAPAPAAVVEDKEEVVEKEKEEGENGEAKHQPPQSPPPGAEIHSKNYMFLCPPSQC